MASPGCSSTRFSSSVTTTLASPGYCAGQLVDQRGLRARRAQRTRRASRRGRWCRGTAPATVRLQPVVAQRVRADRARRCRQQRVGVADRAEAAQRVERGERAQQLGLGERVAVDALRAASSGDAGGVLPSEAGRRRSQCRGGSAATAARRRRAASAGTAARPTPTTAASPSSSSEGADGCVPNHHSAHGRPSAGRPRMLRDGRRVAPGVVLSNSADRTHRLTYRLATARQNRRSSSGFMPRSSS